ncbi:MAG TPA: hypothetical protein VNE39_17940 [Planctomycetota bacterium]|nr:hypothetical protein [Planctomycetota bacterium]
MEFLQQNKFFAIVAGLALAAFVVLWPSVFGLGPSVVSFHSPRYDKAKMEERSIEPKMTQYYPSSGKGVPMKRAVQDIEASNRTLDSNLDELKAWMAFVPRYPFRIPESRTADDERRSYVSLVYTYARTGELLCDECTIKDPSDGVVFLASTRNVPLRDTFFGMPEMATPGAIKDPDNRIMQIALVHELGHLAIRLNVDEITSIAPVEPYKVRLADADVATAYPFNVRLRCDLRTLLAFVHALAGAHGRVARAPGAEEPPVDAIQPIPAPPRPKGAPADDPEDPGPAPAGAPAAPAPAPGDPALQKLVIELPGSPSYLSPDASQGALKERFTIFRRDPANPQKLEFVANAIATRVLDPGTLRLAPESILNWRALCTSLRRQAGDRERNVGKRLQQFLTPAAQEAIKEIGDGKDPSDAHKSAILDSLNDVLASQRGFYRREDFASVPIANEAEGLLKLDRSTLAPEKVQRLNRLLLEAAYPQQIAKVAIQLEAVVEPGSDRCPPPQAGGPTRNVIRQGDFAATRFFLVRGLKVKSAPGAVARDSTGYPTEVTPPHLEVELQVAAPCFLEVQAAKTTEKRPTTTDSTIIHRGY